MTDIAVLGLSINSTQAVKASQDLERLRESSRSTEEQTKRLGTATATLAEHVQNLERRYVDQERELQRYNALIKTGEEQLRKYQETTGATADKVGLLLRAWRSFSQATVEFGPGLGTTIGTIKAFGEAFDYTNKKISEATDSLSDYLTGSLNRVVTEQSRVIYQEFRLSTQAIGANTTELKSWQDALEDSGLAVEDQIRVYRSLNRILSDTSRETERSREGLKSFGVDTTRLGPGDEIRLWNELIQKQAQYRDDRSKLVALESVLGDVTANTIRAMSRGMVEISDQQREINQIWDRVFLEAERRQEELRRRTVAKKREEVEARSEAERDAANRALVFQRFQIAKEEYKAEPTFAKDIEATRAFLNLIREQARPFWNGLIDSFTAAVDSALGRVYDRPPPPDFFDRTYDFFVGSFESISSGINTAWDEGLQQVEDRFDEFVSYIRSRNVSQIVNDILPPRAGQEADFSFSGMAGRINDFVKENFKIGAPDIPQERRPQIVSEEDIKKEINVFRENLEVLKSHRSGWFTWSLDREREYWEHALDILRQKAPQYESLYRELQDHINQLHRAGVMERLRNQELEFQAAIQASGDDIRRVRDLMRSRINDIRVDPEIAGQNGELSEVQKRLIRPIEGVESRLSRGISQREEATRSAIADASLQTDATRLQAQRQIQEDHYQKLLQSGQASLSQIVAMRAEFAKKEYDIEVVQFAKRIEDSERLVDQDERAKARAFAEERLRQAQIRRDTEITTGGSQPRAAQEAYLFSQRQREELARLSRTYSELRPELRAYYRELIQSEQDLERIYGRGTPAFRRALEERKTQIAGRRGEEDRTEVADRIADLREELQWSEKLTEASIEGEAALDEINIQKEIQTQRVIRLTNARKEDVAAIEEQLRAYEELLRKLNAEARTREAIAAITSREDNVHLARAQLDVFGEQRLQQQLKLQKVQDEMFASTKNWTEAEKQRYVELGQELVRLEDEYRELNELAGGAARIFTNTIEDAILNTESWSESVRNLDKQLAALITRVVFLGPLEDFLRGQFEGPARALTGRTEGGVGGFLGGLASIATGGAFASSSIGAETGIFNFGYSSVEDAYSVLGFHKGGVVGEGGGTKRIMPRDLFKSAPRFHSGGLMADEIPAVLRVGEEVLTEDNPRHVKNADMAAVLNAMGTSLKPTGGSQAVTPQKQLVFKAPLMVVQTPDSGGFNRNSDQTLGKLRRVLGYVARDRA